MNVPSGARAREGGWVKVHRQLRSSELFRSLSAEQRSVFLTLLLLANWRDTKAMLGGAWVAIRRGELAHSLATIAEESAVSVKVVRTTIAKLAADDSPAGGRGPFLGSRWTGTAPGTGHRILSVLRYDEYQDEPTEAGTAQDREGARRGHGLGTGGAPGEEGEEGEEAEDTSGRQRGRAEVRMGALGQSLLGEVSAGVELALSPLKTQKEADDLERLVEDHGGVRAALDLIARTCRERSKPGRPYRLRSATLVRTLLQEVAHGPAGPDHDRDAHAPGLEAVRRLAEGPLGAS